MPWFRWKKSKEQQDDAAEAAASTTTAPAEQPAPDGAALAPEPDDDTTDDDTTDATGDGSEESNGGPKKRRRGSRGGRGRKKKPGESTEPAGEDDGTPAKTAEKPKAGEGERSGRDTRRKGGQSRRKQPPRRAPLPAAKRELLISVDVGEQRVAILEDDRVAEVYLERPERRSIAGNIYLGVVDNVLPGMEAAFVEIGLEKNGFLYVDEIVVPELEGKRHGKKIQDLISRGEKLLVQAVKDPMKTKGARLTTEISLPGRFLVFVPNGEGLGVSRRLEDAERQRLKDILKEIAPSEGGVIVRTAAEGASAEDIERDLVFLQRLWKTIQTRAKNATAPELVYQEAELPLRIVRDLFTGDFVAAHVDNERAHKRIVGYLKKTSPHMIERVHRYKEREPLFEQWGVEKEIASTLERRVDLPSGGYLIFDYAEAFTVIDVNTGRFVGSRSKSSTQRLEDTIVKNNLEAVKEVVRQLRLRDIGGIIVIDFIDMANIKNRQAVEEALRTELERDRTKTYVVEISPLGLVEMTRQNVTEGPREVMTRQCPTCGGDGIVVSDATVAMDVERRLRTIATAGAGSRVQAYRVAVHPRILSLLAGPGGRRLAELEEATRRRFFLVPAEGHAHPDHLEVLAEGKLDDLRPASPTEDGAALEVKLVEVGLHDGAAAVAKLDGVDVIVADAAKLVGRKANVVVGRVLEGQVFANLVGAGDVPVPITFESEAEKPTRAPARRKSTEGAAARELAAVDAVEDEADAASETDADAVEPELEGDDDEGALEDGVAAAPKKRTRRGSRGGRRRKKKPAEGADGAVDATDTETDAAEDGEAPEETSRDEAPVEEPDADGDIAPAASVKPKRTRAPRIHVPASDGAERSRAAAPVANAPATVDDEAVQDTSGEAVDEGETAPPGEGDEVTTDGPPKRKRTRRGSRGGRNRKKKVPVDGEAGEVESTGSEKAVETDGYTSEADRDGSSATGDAAPAMTAPSGDEDADAVTADESPPVPEPDPVAATAEADDAVEDTSSGYVPMSEWIDDFDSRTSR